MATYGNIWAIFLIQHQVTLTTKKIEICTQHSQTDEPKRLRQNDGQISNED